MERRIFGRPFTAFWCGQLSKPQRVNRSDNVERFMNRGNAGQTGSTRCFFSGRLAARCNISAGARGDAVARIRHRRTAVLRDARRIRWTRKLAGGLQIFRLPDASAGGGRHA